MLTIDQRLGRIENRLSKVLHSGPAPAKPKRISEKEARAMFKVGYERLRQLRMGTSAHGRYYPPVLFKWGHVRGRRIDYDVEELETYFQRDYITT